MNRRWRLVSSATVPPPPVLVFEPGCIDLCVDQLVPSVEASMETRRTGRERQRRQQAQAPRIGGLRSAVAQTGNGPQEIATGLGISERRAQRASASPESRTSLPALRVSGVMRCPFPPIPRALASPISPASWVENAFIESGISSRSPRQAVPFHGAIPPCSFLRPPTSAAGNFETGKTVHFCPCIPRGSSV